MKARKYEGGGPIGPKAKGVSSKYEENRAKKQKEQQEMADSNRRQNEINKRKRMEENPEQYKKALGVPAFYKPVGGGTVGISSAEYRKAKK